MSFQKRSSHTSTAHRPRRLGLYVKADTLKNGLVLYRHTLVVWLSDTVEGRSSVAEQYYQELSFVIIVTPVIRAVNEQAGVRLMSSYQELCMKLDAKHHGHSFCIAVPKTEDLDCNSFCNESIKARERCAAPDEH